MDRSRCSVNPVRKLANLNAKEGAPVAGRPQIVCRNIGLGLVLDHLGVAMLANDQD